jgi:hypothetical protein
MYKLPGLCPFKKNTETARSVFINAMKSVSKVIPSKNRFHHEIFELCKTFFNFF